VTEDSHDSPGLSPAEILEASRREDDIVTVRRVRFAAAIVVAAMPVYAVLDHFLDQPHFEALLWIKLGTFFVTIVPVVLLYTPAGRRYIRTVTLLLLACMATGSMASSILTDGYVAHTILAVTATFFTGALIPWGIYYQLAAVVLLAASVLLALVITGVGAAAGGYPLIAAGASWSASIWMAHELARTRRALAEQQLRRSLTQAQLQEEAWRSAALARVGRELITHTQRSALLTHLCRLTTELLPCDTSWTTIRDATTGDYRIVAQHGMQPAMAEAMTVVSIPAAEMDPLMEHIRLGLVEGGIGTRSGNLDRMQARFGIHDRIYAALWQGNIACGFQAAAFRDPASSFTPQQKRLFLAIGQLASLALETTRLIEELERASRFKSDFVASMSHELRTPLNVILGYHDLLIAGEFGPVSADQIDTLKRSEKNARELLDLISATLDLSRMDGQDMTLEVTPVVMHELFDELREEMSIGWENPRVAVAWEASPTLPRLRTDRVKLRMVLKNLVHNALKFTVSGRVEISAADRDDGIEIRVRDTGPGIPADQRDRIFDAFHQLDGGNSPGGVGLGLHIVRRLLTALGGSVELESELGVGSTFRIWLPTDLRQPRHLKRLHPEAVL